LTTITIFEAGLSDLFAKKKLMKI